MKWFSILLVFLLVYGTTKQQLYSSASQHKRPDTRISILQAYLTQRKSPMDKEAATFIEVADKEKLDWKLLPAIAGVESGFETSGNIHDFNPFGYMCGSIPCSFSSYKEAIQIVARTISRGSAYATYRNTKRLYELATVYNYVHPEDWTEKIKYFEGKLKGVNNNGIKSSTE